MGGQARRYLALFLCLSETAGTLTEVPLEGEERGALKMSPMDWIVGEVAQPRALATAPVDGFQAGMRPSRMTVRPQVLVLVLVLLRIRRSDTKKRLLLL